MSDDETPDPRLTVNGKRHGGGMTNLINVETGDKCAYVSIHSANKATAKKLGFRWCKGKGDHGKGMWYIREDAETDMKVWAAEQLTPRPRGTYYTPTIRFDQPAGVSSAWEDYETTKTAYRRKMAAHREREAGKPVTVHPTVLKMEEDAVLQSYAKPEETLAERMERERLEALEENKDIKK